MVLHCDLRCKITFSKNIEVENYEILRINPKLVFEKKRKTIKKTENQAKYCEN